MKGKDDLKVKVKMESKLVKRDLEGNIKEVITREYAQYEDGSIKKIGESK